MSEIERFGGSLDHLNEIGLKELGRFLQARILVAEKERDQARAEVEKYRKALEDIKKHCEILAPG